MVDFAIINENGMVGDMNFGGHFALLFPYVREIQCVAPGG
jgi:hypothetical protein